VRKRAVQERACFLNNVGAVINVELNQSDWILYVVKIFSKKVLTNFRTGRNMRTRFETGP